jgi:hypothetical protein
VPKKPVELSLPEIMGAEVVNVNLFMAWLGILTAKVRHFTGFSGEFIVDCQDGEFFILAFDDTPIKRRAQLEASFAAEQEYLREDRDREKLPF